MKYRNFFSLLLIGSATATPISIMNPGFENPTLSVGFLDNDTEAFGWRNGTITEQGDSFIENVSGFQNSGSNHLALKTGNHLVFQVLPEVFEPNSVYTLQVAIGNRGTQTLAAGGSINGLRNGADF